jgi:hypothetical protein
MKQYWMVEEDLSWIDWIKVGTVIDTAQPKLASINGKGSESYNDWAKAELF